MGVPKFNYGQIEEENRIGVVTGLAWTEVGGEILKLSLQLCLEKENADNGKLGEVMQESIKAAKSTLIKKFRFWNYTANI